MTTDRLPQAPARNPEPLPPDLIAQAVEDALARLKRSRPHLEGRVDRAATILTVHLSTSARIRPIRCRIRKNGRRVYLVASLSAGGVTYEVSPLDWSCSCPDHHRRGPGCKHAIGCWVLANANTPLPSVIPAEVPCADCGERFPRDRLIEAQEGQAEETLNPGSRVCRVCAPRHGLGGRAVRGCEHCEGGWVYRRGEAVDPETGEVHAHADPVRCHRCAAIGPGHVSADELVEWMGSVRWRYARSMPRHPHDYSLREWNDGETFERVVRTIWDFGYDRPYIGRVWRSLDVGDEHYIWIHTEPRRGMAAPIEITELVNRAERVQTELIDRREA